MRVTFFIELWCFFMYFTASWALTRYIPEIIFIYYTYDNNGCSINSKSESDLVRG